MRKKKKSTKKVIKWKMSPERSSGKATLTSEHRESCRSLLISEEIEAFSWIKVDLSTETYLYEHEDGDRREKENL